MQKTRQSQRKSPRCTARLWLGFEDLNLQTGLGQNDGRRQTIGTCTNDNGSLWRCRHTDQFRAIREVGVSGDPSRLG